MSTPAIATTFWRLAGLTYLEVRSALSGSNFVAQMQLLWTDVASTTAEPQAFFDRVSARFSLTVCSIGHHNSAHGAQGASAIKGYDA
jgi:hypothetical protein